MGRPSQYTPELAEEICELIASTPRGLEHICRENDNLPSPRTVYVWLATHEDFQQKYVRARERQADLLASETLEIADDKSLDYRVDPERGLIVDGDNIQRARLRIDTRKWMAGKLAPKLYGDKIEHDVKVTEYESVVDALAKERGSK